MSVSRIICFANAKGGVGKTKACISLTDCLVGVHAKNVLVLDLDQQASASLFMLENEVAFLKQLEERHTTIDNYFQAAAFSEDDTSIAKYVVSRVRSFAGEMPIPTRYGSIVPCSVGIDAVEANIISFAQREGIVPPRNNLGWSEYSSIILEMSAKLKQDLLDVCLAESYDYVLIDTAAGMRLLAIVAMCVADTIIVPVIPDVPSLNATARFITQVRQYAIGSGQKLPPFYLLFTKVQTGYKSHMETIDKLSKQQSQILQIPFLQRDIISQLDTSRGPRCSFDEKYSIASGNIRAMSREILSLLDE